MTALGGGVEENFKAQDLFMPLQDKFGHRVVYEAAKFGDNDKAWWIPSRIGSFIVACAWDQQDYPKVEWWKVIWFPKAIPRFAFIS